MGKNAPYWKALFSCKKNDIAALKKELEKRGVSLSNFDESTANKIRRMKEGESLDATFGRSRMGRTYTLKVENNQLTLYHSRSSEKAGFVVGIIILIVGILRLMMGDSLLALILIIVGIVVVFATATRLKEHPYPKAK
ncbi:Uncharacterised protein [uncultured archaeon]|nr:Uncharacterised protein [uncultured archaeon]